LGFSIFGGGLSVTALLVQPGSSTAQSDIRMKPQ